MKLSVIIPVLNEKNTIEKVIEDVISVDISMEKQIIIVDDYSTDGTREILKKLEADKQEISVIYKEKQEGKGAAIRDAVLYVEGDIVIIQDADFEYKVSEYPGLLKPFMEQDADVVFGSRFMGKIKKMKTANLLANKILTNAANLLYGIRITDEATAYKLFKAEFFKKLNLKSKGFEFCPEVVAKSAKLKAKIVEVPVTYEARNVLEGKKIKWKDGFVALWTLIKYRFIN